MKKVFKKVFMWVAIIVSAGLIIYAKCEERRLDREIDEILNGDLENLKEPEEPDVMFVNDEVEKWLRRESN